MKPVPAVPSRSDSIRVLRPSLVRMDIRTYGRTDSPCVPSVRRSVRPLVCNPRVENWKTSVLDAFFGFLCWWWGHGVWMGVGCPCPHVRNDIVTPCHLLYTQSMQLIGLFLSACTWFFNPLCLSVGWSIRLLVAVCFYGFFGVFCITALVQMLALACFHCPCPPARDFGSCVSSLVFITMAEFHSC